jgi:ubiquinone/menaquinone biosynthesis C-methylase UbiE
MVLDAGCGHSASIEIENFVGLDIDRNNIAKIRRKKHGNFVVADLAFIPFKSSCFDVIISQDVLEHVKNKKFAIAEIARVAKSKAHFLGCTTNLMNPFMLLDSSSSYFSRFLKKIVGKGHYERHSRLTPSKLSSMLRKTNFVAVNLYFLAYPNLQPWLYEYGNKKPTWYANLWVIFTKLTRHIQVLREIMLFEAVRE